MSKKILILILSAFLLSSFTITPVFGEGTETIGISGGAVLYVGGSGPGNYSSVQDAVDNASAGDTVFVYSDSSPYYGQIVIDRSINLIGEDRDTTVLEYNINYVVKISADNVNISEFTIESASTGIRVNSNNNSITNSKFICRWNINLSESDGNIISGNIITPIDLRYGIIFTSSDNNIISDNTLTGNLYAISIWGNSGDNIFSGNTIHDNDFALAFYQYNDGNANNVIIGNNIYDNDFGIVMAGAGASGNVITENNISNNEVAGIYMYFYSKNNLVYHNIFIGNGQNAYCEDTNSWDNGYPSGGNYWDDYTGTDGNSDGMGDSPYYIDGGSNHDNYPFIDPDGWENGIPSIPSIDGPTSGNEGEEYEYKIVATDPDGDDVRYYVSWGDADSEWTDFYDSGEEVTLSHIWDEKGSYDIKVKAKDVHGLESGWGTLEVNLLKNRSDLQQRLYKIYLSFMEMIQKIVERLRQNLN